MQSQKTLERASVKRWFVRPSFVGFRKLTKKFNLTAEFGVHILI